MSLIWRVRLCKTQLPSRIAVDFDAAANKGSWSLNVKFTDDRELKDIRLQIPVCK